MDDTTRTSLSPSAERNVIGIAWVLVFVLGLVPPLLHEANTDISWPIYLASRILEGARQGSDFLEVNPPLFIWLAIPPVLLERASGISAWHWNVVLVALAAVLSLGLAARLLPTIVPEPRRRAWWMLAAGFAALVLPRLHYGQREHLAFLLTLPFVILSALRLNAAEATRGRSLVIGLLGGAGFALKPHFLVAWVLLELLLITRRGRAALARPELVALVLFGAAYFVAVQLLVPDYLPMAVRLRPWYDHYLNNGVLGTIILADPFTLFAFLGIVALLVASPDSDPLFNCLAAAFGGFLLSALLQRKGFNYHFVAASCFGLLAIVRGWQVLAPARSWRPSTIMSQASILVVLGFTLRASFHAGRELANPRDLRFRTDPTYPRLLPVVKELARGKPILVLSSNPAAGWPLTLDAGARWASRYMSFWPLPALYHRQLWDNPTRMVEFHDLDQQPEFERKFIEEVAEDIERWQPRLILVLKPDSTQPHWGGALRFDYLRYFRSNQRFEQSFQVYKEKEIVGRYGIWIRDGV